LKWEEVEGSTRYELEIVSHSEELPPKKIKAEKPNWNGDLPFGVYSYRVRAIDRAKRPGDWTDKLPLVVVPTAPRAESPSDGETISVLSDADPKILSWEPQPGASAYKVTVFQNDALVLTKTVTESQINLAELPRGDFTWSVSAVVRAPGRTIASLRGKEWEGKPSDKNRFKIDYRELQKPDLLFPKGDVLANKANHIAFGWKRVPDAKSYVVTLERKADGDGPAPAPIIFKTTHAAVAATVNNLGTYRWKVRALASVDPIPGATSEASGTFDLIPSGQGPGRGYVSLSGMYAPYTYGIQTRAGRGDLSSQAVTVRLAGEAWLYRQWGAGAGIQKTTLKVEGESYSLGNLEAFVKYRMPLGSAASGWLFIPKLGLESRDYVFLTPSGSMSGGPSLIERQVNTNGLALGFDLRKQLSDRWSVGLKVAYFKPITLSGTEGGEITSSDSARNISAGLQGFRWMTRSWALGLGGFLDRRSFSYTSPSTGPESVNMDALHLFGSLLFLY
jgi:hypothetical protein